MKRFVLIIAGILMSIMLMACAGEENAVKYRLILNDSGFESQKSMYAPGEQVMVRYDIFATDTDYRFYSSDVDFKQDYDNGYVFTFVMPDHDVTLNVESRNSMEYDPNAYVAQTDAGTAKLSFDSFDGGGPEFNVIVEDESIVEYTKDVSYKKAGHEQLDGAGKEIVIIFTGQKPGQTNVTVEERSPIADNLDRRYKVTVDDNLSVSIEEISVKDINEGSEDLTLYINDEEVPVTWENNPSVEELKAISPLTISMSMYGGFEQVGQIGSSITRDDTEITTEPGDIVLYSGNQIVIFYGKNTWAYTRLGHVDMTKEEMTALLGKGNVEISIE